VFTVYAQLHGKHLLFNDTDLYVNNFLGFKEAEGYWQIELTDQGFSLVGFVPCRS
jgi:hypothetical protein